MAFQPLKIAYRKNGAIFLARPVTVGQGVMVLNSKRVDLDWIQGRNFFRMRVVKHWKRLPREVVKAPSLETFQVKLDGARSNLI